MAFRYLDLSFTFTLPAAAIVDDQVLITINDRDVPDDVRRFLVERDLTAIWTVLREIAGGDPRPTALTWPFRALSRPSTRHAPGCSRRGTSTSTAPSYAWLRHDSSWRYPRPTRMRSRWPTLCVATSWQRDERRMRSPGTFEW